MDSRQKMLRRLAHAQAIIAWATSQSTEYGVTVVVHDRKLRAGGINLALHTTLPDRAAVRVVLGETMARTVLADGGSLDDIAELASADLRAYEDRERERES